MITTKELQFVDTWANRVPMPGQEYCKKIMEDLKVCYETYNKIYKDREYNLIFSNSDEIKFSVLPKNLCHMLGIDFANICGDYFSEFRKKVLSIDYNTTISSFDLLTCILENSDKVIENDCDPMVRAKAINYYKSGIKSAIFKKLSDFDKFNFAAINYVGRKEGIDYNKSKMLFVPSNEAVCPYFMMGIKQQEESVDEMYIVSTLLAPSDPKTFFENQEVVIPTQILISNNDVLEKIVATSEEKLKLLNMYKNIVNEYKIKSNINIYGDYESTLNDSANTSRILSKVR